MGVLLAKRKESLSLAEIKAIELETQIAKLGIKLPQKYNRYGTARAYQLSSEIMDDITKGNHLYFAKDHIENYQARQDYFNNAISKLHCLASHVTFLCELVDPNLDISQEDVKNQQQSNNVNIDNNKPKPKKIKIKPKDWYKIANLINECMAYVKKLKDSDVTRMESFISKN